MKPILKVSVLMALVFGLTISVSAQQRSNDADRPRIDRQEQMKKMRANQGQQHQRMLTMLELSEVQREQIQEIRLNGQKGMLPLRNALQEKRARLRTLNTSEDYNKEAINEVVAEIGELRTAMLTMRMAHRQQVREILTDEQRIKFDSRQRNSTKRQPRNGIK